MLNLIANKPENFKTDDLLGMIKTAAGEDGAFLPVRFKMTSVQLADLLSTVFDEVYPRSSNHAIVNMGGKQCSVYLNGYVTGWSK